MTLSELGPLCSFYHGACLVFLDGIGSSSGPSILSNDDAEKIIKSLFRKYELDWDETNITVKKGAHFYGISPFFIEKGNFSTILNRSE